MAESTSIGWTDSTWNVVTGCTRVSPGCANCYIERTPPFRMSGRRFATIGGASTTGVQLHPERLDVPLRWRKPRRVFVCSLADLFHDDVPDEFLRTVFAVMASARDHTFQVLTKRPERARAFFASHHWRSGFMFWPAPSGRNDLLHTFPIPDGADVGGIPLEDGWAPPNVWMGVSIENARYTWRADVLREIPAAVRFISAEPLLGSLFPKSASGQGRAVSVEERPASEAGTAGRSPLDLTGIDWIIVGGESGPKARPFHLEHAREIVETARTMRQEWGLVSGAGVEIAGHSAPSIFVKQLGAKPHESGVSMRLLDPYGPVRTIKHPKGEDWSEWPADLRIREFPRSRA